jgi:hypothetical protein
VWPEKTDGVDIVLPKNKGLPSLGNHQNLIFS